MSYTIDATEAAKLVADIVSEFFTKRRAPIPGAVLKAELVKRVIGQSKTFDERAIGFRTFSEFLSKSGSVSVERRPGSDILVLPREVAASLERSPSPRIRPEIWHAFLSFPIPGTQRMYDPSTDQVIYEQDDHNSDKPIITPITTEQQLAWRKEFASTLEQDEEEELMKVFKNPNPFREFSIFVRRQPLWAKGWNSFLFQKVLPIVEKWAADNDIRVERILRLPKEQSDSSNARKKVYAFLDQITIEQLLQLQIPIGWIIKKD